MNACRLLDDITLPVLIRTYAAFHLLCLTRAHNLHTLSMAEERDEGFVEGLEPASVLNPSTLEVLLGALKKMASARRQTLER